MKYVYWIQVRVESNAFFPVLQVFWPFVLSKACWWVAVNMLKLYWEKRNWWLQLHFRVRSTSFSKVWFQLTFFLRSLGSFGFFFWERSLTNLTPLHGILRDCQIFAIFFFGRSLANWTTSHVSLWESIPRFKYFSQQVQPFLTNWVRKSRFDCICTRISGRTQTRQKISREALECCPSSVRERTTSKVI
jgi:hypothetical protein